MSSGQVVRLVGLWDATFSVGYFEARRATQELAAETLERVADATLVSPAEARAARSGEGAYVFTDDDDWLAPDLAQALAANDDGRCEAFLWGSARYGGDELPSLELRGFGNLCFTNNYAVTSAWLALDEHNMERVCGHTEADIAFGRLRVRRVARYLSVTNKSPVSITWLARAVRDGESPERLRASAEALAVRLAAAEELAPPELMWARPAMRRAAALVAELTRR